MLCWKKGRSERKSRCRVCQRKEGWIPLTPAELKAHEQWEAEKQEAAAMKTQDVRAQLLESDVYEAVDNKGDSAPSAAPGHVDQLLLQRNDFDRAQLVNTMQFQQNLQGWGAYVTQQAGQQRQKLQDAFEGMQQQMWEAFEKLQQQMREDLQMPVAAPPAAPPTPPRGPPGERGRTGAAGGRGPPGAGAQPHRALA